MCGILSVAISDHHPTPAPHGHYILYVSASVPFFKENSGRSFPLTVTVSTDFCLLFARGSLGSLESKPETGV